MRWSAANLLAATRQAALSGLYEFAWQLPTASLGFFNRRTYWADWVETHQIALASARQIGDRRGEAMVLNNLGIGYARRLTGDAIGCFEQAMDIRREIGDRPGKPRPRPTWPTRTSCSAGSTRSTFQQALTIHAGRATAMAREWPSTISAKCSSRRAGLTRSSATLGQARDIFAPDRRDARRGIRPGQSG